MSSMFFILFLAPSTYVFSWCMEGMRHGVLLPVVSSLCFSPMAACSCFSTAVILASNSAMDFGEVVVVAGCVEVSFS